MPPERINAIVDMTPNADTVADIGCDHGKTALFLLERGIAKSVICTDVSDKSLDKARALITGKGLEDKAEFRVCDGFTAFRDGEVQAAVISGLGGDVIVKILKNGGDRLPDKLVLSCNSKADILRRWLAENGFCIEDESMISESRRYYPVILAVRGETYTLSEAELEFGPVLMRKKSKVLIRYVEDRIKKTKLKKEMVMNSEAADLKKLSAAFDKKLKEYEEVMKCLLQ